MLHYNILDVLLCAYEGFFPFIQEFYSNYYDDEYFEQSQVEGTTTEDFYKGLLVRILSIIQHLLQFCLFALQAIHSSVHSSRVYFDSKIQLERYYRAYFLVKPHITCELSGEVMICL